MNSPTPARGQTTRSSTPLNSKAGKYSRKERERRFLLSGEAPNSTDRVQIIDRYINRTRLRLRSVDGIVWKLAKIEDIEPGVKRITNLYLSREEFDLLATLPAREARKERSRVDHQGVQWAIDIYESGVIICEVEIEPEDQIAIPDWCGEEVTGNPGYSGFALAE